MALVHLATEHKKRCRAGQDMNWVTPDQQLFGHSAGSNQISIPPYTRLYY